MLNVVEITKQYFDIEPSKLAECGGAHYYCLNCRKCRKDDESLIYDPAKPIADYIDHTNLKADAVEASISKLCEEGLKYKFKSVCVSPVWVEYCHHKLRNSPTLVCVVVGFPLGANLAESKVEEASRVIEKGAKEVDMVINISHLKDKKIDLLIEEIGEISRLCHSKDVVLKVILENCLLSKEEIILASLVVKKAGGDYVKTSTGFSTGGAILEDVALMREVVGDKMGVKAAGGIASLEMAKQMLSTGASRIGTSRGAQIINESV
ncbi:MAG: deoxyribose-phosphate aldolase [Candidatus Cloacimonas sp.]|nr:deoxyribose-phosphate aldolase [Candidatus Cloacimonadota bacterium]